MEEEKKTIRPHLTEEELHRLFDMYYREDKTRKEISEELNLSVTSVSKHLNNLVEVAEYGKKLELSKRHALNYVLAHALDASRKQNEIMNLPITEKNVFAVQNAARDFSDRAGIRAKDEEQQSINITFSAGNMPNVSMPPEEKED